MGTSASAGTRCRPGIPGIPNADAMSGVEDAEGDEDTDRASSFPRARAPVPDRG
jgi:hypothetical protein